MDAWWLRSKDNRILQTFTRNSTENPSRTGGWYIYNLPRKTRGRGGGAFVALSDDTPLIIAGGGGGGSTARNQFNDGDPGQATEDGTQCGGKGGNGGQLCNANTGNSDSSLMSGGGAGLYGDGTAGNLSILTAALSFAKGGNGGVCPLSNGGFGGGGFAMALGGGGGGYSGGGVMGTQNKGTAGGGGSYNNGANQQNMAGVNKGDGKVIIRSKPYV